MEALSLIDVSAEDDFLLDLASPPQHPDPPPGASAAAAAGRVLDPGGATERAESPKRRNPKGAVNLRKSLAWDSAFFTGEGVLDTEELGIVNSTFRKAQGSRLLPGIAEEMRRSTESTTSTIESESFLLESLDSDLFDNVRASVQRTLGKPEKAPAVTAASSKSTKAAAAKAPPPVTARKGVDRIPLTQSKIRPPGSTSNGVGSKQRPQVTPKEPTVTRGGVSSAAEAKPSSRPPRALPRVATMGAPANTAATSGVSDKRSSTGGVVNRQAVGKSANTSAGVPSRPGWGTKTSSTTKSGALSSTSIPSLHSAPIGTTAGAKTKSPTLIGKTRTAQRVPIRSSPRAGISKVEPAIASRNKIVTRSSIESASPTISPSSSVDSMSSVISGVSTASTIGRVSQTSESFSTRSSSLSPSTRKSNDHPPITKPRALTVTEGTPCDNRKSNIDTSNQGNGFKPSGLRRPTPKIGYFDAEKSVEQKAARVQVQSKNVLFSPLATPNPRISSTPKANFEFSTSDEQELKFMAAALSHTKASPSLPLRVAQAEVKPSKVVEHEASQIKAPLRVAEVEVESSKVTEEVSHTGPSPSLALRVAQTEVDLSKAMEHQASRTEALPLLPLGVAQTDVESSKVMEHEASQIKAPTSLPLRVAEVEVESSKVTEEVSHTQPSPSLRLRVAQTEVDSSKVSQHETHMLETGPLVAVDIAEESIPALRQIIQDNGDGSLATVKLSSCTIDQQESETSSAPGGESSPFQTNVAQTEAEPSEVIEHEASQSKASPSLPLGVAKKEVDTTAASGGESSPSQTNVAQTEVEPSEVIEPEASQSKASLPLGVATMEVDTTAAPGGESPSRTYVAQTEVEPSELIEPEASQSKTSPSLPLGVATMEVEPSEVIDNEACMPQACPPSIPLGIAEMEVEPSEVVDREACMGHAWPVFAAVDTAKENIPALHQDIHPSSSPSPLKKNILTSHDNIQAEGDATPVKGSILASHPNVQAIGEMTPVTLLTQKLSSISLGAANGDATPLTLLAQKLSSISLEDATD
nr:endochitinase A-like isoform X7 [Lolium perenne]